MNKWLNGTNEQTDEWTKKTNEWMDTNHFTLIPKP